MFINKSQIRFSLTAFIKKKRVMKSKKKISCFLFIVFNFA